jgi:hypothetical protein
MEQHSRKKAIRLGYVAEIEFDKWVSSLDIV